MAKGEIVAIDLTKAVLGATLIAGWSSSALAQELGNSPLQIQPLFDGRLRYEHVDQPSTEANALTFRLRVGAELTLDSWYFLAEAEGNFLAAVLDDHMPVRHLQRIGVFDVDLFLAGCGLAFTGLTLYATHARTAPKRTLA